MPHLGDYLGHLLSEITIARMHADIETVRVAEQYAADPLLRNMPVPHFRLPNVEIDVPVVVKQVEEQPADALPRGAPTLADMQKAFDKVLKTKLSEEGICLQPAQRNKLNSALNTKIASLKRPTSIAFSVHRIAGELARVASETLTEPDGPVESARRPILEKKLKEAARVEFLGLRKPPPRLVVLATTAEIREAGPSEVITRLNLKVTEEAFEWTTIESDGREQERLVVE